MADLYDEYKKRGDLGIAIVLKPRAVAQKGFFSTLARTFEVAVLLAKLEDGDLQESEAAT